MKFFFKTMALLSVALLCFACNKENDPTFDQELQAKARLISQNETFVSITKAADVAAVFFGKLKNDPLTKSNVTIASTETICDSKNNNAPMMYVMNYTGGGFVIVSAPKITILF